MSTFSGVKPRNLIFMSLRLDVVQLLGNESPDANEEAVGTAVEETENPNIILKIINILKNAWHVCRRGHQAPYP